MSIFAVIGEIVIIYNLIKEACEPIPLLKEEMENQGYREVCRRRGDKMYWSTDELRYTSKNTKVYK